MRPQARRIRLGMPPTGTGAAGVPGRPGRTGAMAPADRCPGAGRGTSRTAVARVL